MHLTLGQDFDHGYWPGPLGERSAAAGEAWVGPMGFLSVLETTLGLGGPKEPTILRPAALVPAVLATEGFWSRSAVDNPLASARTLLAWRDRLWMHGWRGEGLTQRLRQLATVTEGARPGFPDRLEAIAAASNGRETGITTLYLCEERTSWAPLWRDVFDALTVSGVRIRERPVNPAESEGALGATRRAFLAEATDAQVITDASLQLVRPYGPVEAAEEIAAWLAGQDDLAGTVILDGDPVLDRALRRHGLPSTGAAPSDPRGALLQVLPLALALAWDPPDPQRAMELLTLPNSPIHGELRWRFRRALAEWPAVGSDTWSEALRLGLEAIDDPETRERAAERCRRLLEPRVPRGESYPVGEALLRIRTVREWLAARRALESENVRPWDAALAQCSTLEALLGAATLETLSAAQLDRFVEQGSRAAPSHPPLPAETGLTRVGRPGCVIAPAERIVWWGFELGAATRVPAWPFGHAERSALAAAGIDTPDLGRQALEAAERWRRPLLCARQTLLLVCPGKGTAGDDLHPHPLWDEVTGRLGETTAAALEAEAPLGPTPAPRETISFRPLPKPRRDWTIDPGQLAPRESESPSSLASLVGCSFRWALQYAGRLRLGHSSETVGESALLGKLLHEIVEQAVRPPSSPGTARERALELFDRVGPKLAAPFYLPGNDAIRGQARRLAGDATQRLAEILATDGRQVLATEISREREWLDGKLRGRIDLLVGEPPGIIDLKLGSSKYRREELEAGLSSLAIYSYILQDETGRFPPYAYYILADQRLLASDGEYFSEVDPVAALDPEETFAAWSRSAQARYRALAAGRLEAPANPNEAGEILPEESALVDGLVVLEPPCRFCDFGLLCGLDLAEDDS